MVSTTPEYDCIVIGGGPAGSTAAAVLAEKGRRVLILEKEKFPRYKVGESLLPYCYFTLERLGVARKIARSDFVRKYSVQFVDTDGHVSQPFYFFQHLHHAASRTWQVVRSDFDQMLLDNAREKGADVMEQTTARHLLRSNGAVEGVAAALSDGRQLELRAPMTIDASGRDAFSVNRQEWKIRDPNLQKISIWNYYKGALRDDGLDEGATTVAYLPGKGWFWYIPLANDTVSVGVVAERDYLYRDGKNPETVFQREAHVNPWIRRHLAPGQVVGPYRVTGDYSYTSRYCAADGLVLVGDALGFLDPVFSSGVFLALRGGEMAGDAVDSALESGDTSGERFAAYGRDLYAGIETMRKLVYAFYSEAFSFGKLMRAHPDLGGDLTDCLIGNLFRDFDRLFHAVGESVDMPAAPGGPPGVLGGGDQDPVTHDRGAAKHPIADR